MDGAARRPRVCARGSVGLAVGRRFGGGLAPAGAKRLDRLDRVGVDDLVPDPLLPLLRGQVADVPVHHLELGHRGDVEARSLLEEGAHDHRIGVFEAVLKITSYS